MAPRVQVAARQLQQAIRSHYVCQQCRHASLAAVTAPATPLHQESYSAPIIKRFPTTQPPSYKPAEFRKTQLHRQYQSLLRSSQVMLIFQHNNLKAAEWMAVRRELAEALRKVDEEQAKNGDLEYIGNGAKIQIVQTGIFASALKVVEFWKPDFENTPAPVSVPAASAQSLVKARKADAETAHGLSQNAWTAAKRNSKLQHGLEPLLSGPIALFTIPNVSTVHLKAALSILAPSTEFPAPKRKAKPTYYEPAVQNGLQKLMLLGARIEGQSFDTEGTKWVGSVQGGIDGLRAQLVAALQGVGAGITNTLEAAGRSLYITVEGRRGMLEEEAKGSASE